MDTNDLLEADVEQLGSNIIKAHKSKCYSKNITSYSTVSGQLNQTFNLSKYNHNQNGKEKKQTQNSS
jgi:hypothetical protein